MDNESVDVLKSKMLSRVTNTMNFVSDHIENENIDMICAKMQSARTIFYLVTGLHLLLLQTYFKNYLELD